METMPITMSLFSRASLEIYLEETLLVLEFFACSMEIRLAPLWPWEHWTDALQFRTFLFRMTIRFWVSLESIGLKSQVHSSWQTHTLEGSKSKMKDPIETWNSLNSAAKLSSKISQSFNLMTKNKDLSKRWAIWKIGSTISLKIKLIYKENSFSPKKRNWKSPKPSSTFKLKTQKWMKNFKMLLLM